MSDIIATRRHKKLLEKSDIFQLLSDSYKGGYTYKSGNHLLRYSIREPQSQFDDRKKRAIYINTIRPILDILVSFIFNDNQEREYPTNLNFLKDKVGGQRGIQSFMRNLATHTGLYTCGVLVDSPSQEDTQKARSLAEQKRLGLQPFAKIYTPDRIRDFHHDHRGELEWVLLDDTETDKSDPTSESTEKVIYTLWTKTDYTKYEVSKRNKKTDVSIIAQDIHEIGYVPFRIVNWKEIDDDYISDTPFETAAIISKQIYNVMSYLDEMLAGGTFKTLFYPANDPKKIPAELTQSGASGSVAVTYPVQGNVPFFAGQGLENVDPFIAAINFYVKQIMSIFGMDEDRDKKFVQSGVAKSLEFSKSDAMLSSAAQEFESTEKWIVNTAGRYLGIKDANPKINYQKEYQSEEIEQQIARVMQLTMTPFETMNKESWKFIAKNVLSHVEDDTMKKIIDEIMKADDEARQEEIKLKAEELANEEMKARQCQELDENNTDTNENNKQQSDADKAGKNA